MQEQSIITPELKVLNFKESLGFYTNLAKFDILYTRPEHDFAMLSMNGARLMIEGLTDKSRTLKVGVLERPFGRGMHFQIKVDDVQGLYQNFTNSQYPIFHEMEEKWYRQDNEEVGHNQFWVQDPDGYLLRFFEGLGKRPILN